MEQKGPAKTLVRSSTVTFDNAAFENIDTTFFLSDFAEKTILPGEFDAWNKIRRAHNDVNDMYRILHNHPVDNILSPMLLKIYGSPPRSHVRDVGVREDRMPLKGAAVIIFKTFGFIRREERREKRRTLRFGFDLRLCPIFLPETRFAIRKEESVVRWFGNLSTRGKVLSLVALVSVLLGCVGYTGYRFNAAGAASLKIVYEERLQPISLLLDCMIHSQAVRANTYALLLATDEKENQTLFGDNMRRMKIIDESVDSLSKLSLDATGKGFLNAGKSVLQQYRDVRGKVQELAMANKNSEAYAKFQKEALPLFLEYQRQFRALSEHLRKSAEELNRRNASDEVTAVRLLVGISLGAVLLAVLLGIFIASRISKPLNRLRDGVERFATGDLTVEFESNGKDEIARMGAALEKMADKLRDSMRSIFAASKRLGENAEEFSALAEESNAGVEEARAGIDDIGSQMENLASASQEINASVEEVAGGAQSSAQKSTEMAGEVENARKAGEDGMSAVGKVVGSIVRVSEDSGRTAGEVRGLGDRAREIQSFVAQIGGIADQTNLLALNAAIEAARAGEAGRGFAVVAEEVRKLAEESNRAAKKIADLAGIITKDLDKVVTASENNAKDSRESSDLARETQETIRRMMDALGAISGATQDLAAVSEEQAASSEEIATAVQSIASRVGAAAASSETVRGQVAEVAAAAERVAKGSMNLAGLSAELQKLVAFFRFSKEREGAGLVALGAPKK